MPPQKIILHFSALRDHHHAGVEDPGGAGVKRAVKGCREQAGRDRHHLLHVAVEPQCGVFAFKIGQQEGIFVALAVGEAAAGHLLAELQGGLIERVGQTPAVGPLQTSRELVKAAPVYADHHMGAPRQAQPQGIFVVALHAAA